MLENLPSRRGSQPLQKQRRCPTCGQIVRGERLPPEKPQLPPGIRPPVKPYKPIPDKRPITPRDPEWYKPKPILEPGPPGIRPPVKPYKPIPDKRPITPRDPEWYKPKPILEPGPPGIRPPVKPYKPPNRFVRPRPISRWRKQF